MDMTAMHRAGELLGTARLNKSRLKALPAEYTPPDEASAYAIQEIVGQWLTEHGLGQRIGYKVGLVSAEMRRVLGGREVLGVDSPVTGEIHSSTLYEREAGLRFGDFIRPYVEGEFAVSIGHDIPEAEAPFTLESIAPYVGTCMAGIELVDWRLDYFDYKPPLAPLMIADGGSNCGAVVGEPITNWQALDIPSLEGRMIVDGVEVGRGIGADLLGHPFEVLAWLANSLIARGRSLQAGEIAMLGAVTPSYAEFGPGSEIIVSWENLGEVRARFE